MATKVFCVIAAIILALGAMLVGKNASSMFGYYMAKFMGIAAAIFVILFFVVPKETGVIDRGYCVLSALVCAIIFFAIFFRLLKYIFAVAIIGGGIWLLAWVFKNAMADGGIFGISVIVAILFFVTLFIFGLIKKAVK